MATTDQEPIFTTRAPNLINTGNVLSFSIPILNTGNGPANDLAVTGMALGAASSVGPVLPVTLGTLTVDNATSLNGGFSLDGLVVGSRYVISVKGTYTDVSGKLLGFTVNRVIQVPTAQGLPLPSVNAGVDLVRDPVLQTWTYTIHNNEQSGSPLYIATFALDVYFPFTVISTPPGWGVDTDNSAYALWYATDEQLPYPHHIAPGNSLGGFVIQSSGINAEGHGYILTSWNHETDTADITAIGSVLTPTT
jgi:hypothetical protein